VWITRFVFFNTEIVTFYQKVFLWKDCVYDVVATVTKNTCMPGFDSKDLENSSAETDLRSMPDFHSKLELSGQ
jgi:hypothetical protein